MITAEIKEFKKRLSYYLSHVKRGQDVIITASGKPAARVIRENTDKIPLREPLEPLIGKGMIEYPVNRINRGNC